MPKPRAPKPAATTKRTASKPAPARPARARPAKRATARPATVAARRADFGAPIAGFFSKQPKALRPLLEQLRDLVQEVVPDATSSLKWGMPFFMLDGVMMCALGGHKSHINLILSGPPGLYADPDGRLSGGGKTGRHLKLTAADAVPRDAVRGWLRTAAKHARVKP